MNDRRLPVIPIACLIGSATLQALVPLPGQTTSDGSWCGQFNEGISSLANKLNGTDPHQVGQPVGSYWDIRKHAEMPEYLPGEAPVNPQPVPPAPVPQALAPATPLPPPPPAQPETAEPIPGANWQPPKPGDPNYSPTDAAAGLYDANPPAEDCRDGSGSGVVCRLVPGGEAL